MELDFKLYPRGFSFSDIALDNVPQEYINKKILNKYYYSRCNSTDSLILEKQNKFVIVHGNATHVHYSTPISNEDLPNYLLDLFYDNYNEFLNVLDYIAGRYAVIIGDKEQVSIFQDATASRSVYFSLQYNIIASHVHLINDNKKHIKDEKVENVFRLGFNWNLSPFEDIKALTPNLYLDFYSKETFRFFPREKNRFTHLSTDEKLEIAEKLWKNQYRYFFSKFNNLAFSITGGIDSRVSLAMLKDKIPNIKFFTYMSGLPNPTNEKNLRLLRNDGIKVKELLDDIQLNHTFIQLENVSKKLSDTDKYRLSKNTIGKHNFGLLRSYKNLFPDENTLHIRSNLSEIGSANLMENNRGNTAARVVKYFVTSFYRTNKEKVDEFEIDLQQISEQGFKDFKYDNKRFDYHIMDLYYWENRVGRWASEILNETDVCFETFSGYNLRAIIEIALSFNFEDRHSNFFLKELINRNYSVLNFYGINANDNLYEQNKSLMKKLQLIENEESLKKYAQKSSEKIYEKINSLKKETFNEFMKFNSQVDNILTMNQENIKELSKNRFNQTSNKNLFSKFTIVDKKEKTEIITKEKQTIYLPSHMLYKDNYAEIKYTYGSQAGKLDISLQNNYKNHKALQYIKYQVIINNQKIIEEDIAYWNNENNLVLYNLEYNDLITFRVIVLRDCPEESWSNASRLFIKSIKETEMDIKVPVDIKVSSPYTKILNNNL